MDRTPQQEVFPQHWREYLETLTSHIHDPFTITTDHGSLLGLMDDDHTLLHNDARANTWLATKTTDNLSEGLVNLYYTDARARAAISGASPLSYNSVTGAMSWDITAAVTAGSLKVAGNLGFFNLAPVAQTTVADPLAIVTTEVAGAAYGANEQLMLNNLKTDVTNLISKLTELVNALQSYNLV